MGRGFKLTQLQVERLKADGVHGDGAGLYLNVTKGGSKSWLYRYMLAGKAHWMGLGSYPDVSLAEAREKSADCRKLTRQGIDPLREKRQAVSIIRAALAKTIIFDDAAAQYIAAKEAEWTNARHIKQWKETLETYASPIIGNLDVSLIETAHVMRVLQPIWEGKTETATRLRGRIEKILDWAKVGEYRTGENPARWNGHLEHKLGKPGLIVTVEHHAALPYGEVGSFIQQLRAIDDQARRLMEFTILTNARSSESRLATWAEVNFDNATWTIPAKRMKAKKEHLVPLSKRAVKILMQQKANKIEGNDFLFPGRRDKPLSRGVFDTVLSRMERTDITTHGFRSSFRDWAGETTAYPREVIEHGMAHQLKDKAEAAYARGSLFDKRRRLMEDWAKYCDTVISAANVVPIRSNAA